MPPNVTEEEFTGPEIHDDTQQKLPPTRAAPREYKIMWFHVIAFAYQHISAVYGLYLLFYASWATLAFNCLTYYLSVVAVCAGAHRLWSHRAYKATKSLQIFLMLCHSMSNQYTIFLWARDHRLHHRYSDTDADPHNASRGLFFSHIGWVLVDRHPEIYKRGKLVDMKDITNNPIVMFQKRYQTLLNSVLCYVIPTLIPYYFWNETFSIAYHINMVRFIISLNGTFSINSLAHMFGNRPYDKNLKPTQNIITNLTTFGEGYHNYHHTFPYDYKAGEFGNFMNFSASFIDFCARLGLAYDLKSVPDDVVKRRMERSGDGTEAGPLGRLY